MGIRVDNSRGERIVPVSRRKPLTRGTKMIGRNVNKSNGYHEIFNTGGWGNKHTTKKAAIQAMADTNRYSEAKHGERIVSCVVQVKEGEIVAEFK